MRVILIIACGVIAGVLAFGLLSGSNELGMKSIPLERIKQKYTNAHSRFMDYRGMKIHYRDEGSGPALILIHGVCASLHTWDGWADMLKHDFRIIRVDLPGFGLTPLTDIQFMKREASVKMVHEIAAALGLEKFSMAGNSLGGYVAWTYALAHPEKVDRLILVDPAGYRMDFPWILAFASHPVVRPFSRLIMPRFMFDMAVNQVYGDKRRVTDAVKNRYFELAMREGGKRDYLQIFAALQNELKKSSIADGIDQLTVPLLLMWGDKDTWIPYPEYYNQWKKDYPGASFIVYTGAGHVPMEEIPDITAADARSFLTGKMGPGEIVR